MSYSIVIPTYHRTNVVDRNFLKDSLTYYDRYHKGCRVLIADSSTPEFMERNSATIESFKDIKIDHFCYGSDIHFMEKIYNVVTEIDTEYNVICGDDDFLIPDYLHHLTAFLDHNPTYSSACGVYLRYNPRSGIFRHIYRIKEKEMDNPLERCLYHITHYNPTMYSIHRAEDTKWAYEIASHYKADDAFCELITSLLFMAKGNSMRFQEFLYYIKRKTFNTVTVATPDSMDETYHKNYNSMKSLVLSNLPFEEGFDRKFDKAFRIHLREGGEKEMDRDYVLSHDDKSTISKVAEILL